jgi:CRP-like cAMP-binding protein
MIGACAGFRKLNIFPFQMEKRCMLASIFYIRRIAVTDNNQLSTEQLGRLEPLSSLSEARLQELATGVTRERLATGVTVFREGETDNRTIYLLSGKLLLANNAADQNLVLAAGTDEALHPVADKQPRLMTAVTAGEVELVRFDSERIEMLMTWDELAEQSAEPGQDAGLVANDTSAFKRLPPANFEQIRERMEPVRVSAGDVVMKEADPGDYYYLIESGRARVTRQGAGGQLTVAELGAGDGFGEEALVSNNPRNATVTMITDGRLMRLGKSDFNALMREPLVNWISLADARRLVESGGAKWLDVRTISEFRHARVTNAIFCPLRDIRRQLDRLDRNSQYICYCKTGKRSSAAAYILNERGFKAHALQGGLQALPDSE